MCVDESLVVLSVVKSLSCPTAGHVAIEVGELSDGQEKGDGNKQSSGQGRFLLSVTVLSDCEIKFCLHLNLH